MDHHCGNFLYTLTYSDRLNPQQPLSIALIPHNLSYNTARAERWYRYRDIKLHYYRDSVDAILIAFFGGFGLDAKPYLMQTLRLVLKGTMQRLKPLKICKHIT